MGAGYNPGNTPPTFGSVTITWESSTGTPVAPPVTPSNCGPSTQRTTQIPALAQVALQATGGSGGASVDLSLLTSLGNFYGSKYGGEGFAASIYATYQNTSSFPVDVTAIQGCQGAIGGENGVTQGGDGLETALGDLERRK